jgi:acyl-CoA thioesterase
MERRFEMDFTDTFGMHAIDAADGLARIEIEVAPVHMSRAARVHGGVLFTMLDTALGRAIISTLPEGRGCATVECKINYFRPVTGGRIVAEAHVVTKTKRTAYAEGSITDEENRLIARASGTFFLTETMTQAERERV